MFLEKSRKKTIKDHNRNFGENLKMFDNKGIKSGAEEVRTPDLLNAIQTRCQTALQPHWRLFYTIFHTTMQPHSKM
jgi:hypothetical protein